MVGVVGLVKSGVSVEPDLLIYTPPIMPLCFQIIVGATINRDKYCGKYFDKENETTFFLYFCCNEKVGRQPIHSLTPETSFMVAIVLLI